MCTDKYIDVKHWSSVEEFLKDQKMRSRELVAIENNVNGASPLAMKNFIEQTTLVFGSEGTGISSELLHEADDVRYIESFGSTRSLNVGVAAGVVMYEWVRQNILEVKK